MKSLAFVGALLAVFTSQAAAIGSPLGFASGTTGGAGGVTVTPTTTTELLNYLADSTTRTIILTKIFDFTSYYGTATGTACKPWTCSNGDTPQMLLNTVAGGCEGKTLYSVTYYNSGQNKGLYVGSNKTILGKGSNAGLKGIGLKIQSVSNVIVQNIKITDLNPAYVWGGDAISIAGSSKVWIDHCYFARMGRQFIVTGFDANSAITISNNFFDGESSYSVSCNGMHYWAFIFAGKTDTITFIYNHIYYTSGRGPHAAGYDSSSLVEAHLVNNYFDTIGGHAIDAGTASVVLTEGNYFKSVTTPDTNNPDGLEYICQTVAEASTCSSYLGRVCEWNRFESSGMVTTRTATSVLSTLGAYSLVKNRTPMSVADVPAYVLANSGVGIIN